MHPLPYDILNMIEETWSTHQCGIGIFTMQGYEIRNKVSKNVMRDFNNNKHQKLP